MSDKLEYLLTIKKDKETMYVAQVYFEFREDWRTYNDDCSFKMSFIDRCVYKEYIFRKFLDKPMIKFARTCIVKEDMIIETDCILNPFYCGGMAK
jgi:hypothetical protein